MKARNREVLYALSRTFERAAARRQRSGEGGAGGGRPAAASLEGAAVQRGAPPAGAAAAEPSGRPAPAPARAVPGGDRAPTKQQKKRKAPGALVILDGPAVARRKAPHATASTEDGAASSDCLPPSSMAEEKAAPSISGREAPVTAASKANLGPSAARLEMKAKGPVGKGKKGRRLLPAAEASGGTPAAAASSSSFTAGLSDQASPAIAMPAASGSGRARAILLANGSSGMRTAGKASQFPPTSVPQEKAAGAGSVKSRLRQLQTAKGTPGMTDSARKKVQLAWLLLMCARQPVR